MSGLLHLGIRIAGLALRQTATRITGASVIFATAMVFLLTGLLGFVLAAFLLLAELTSPLIAALICGGFGMVTGAVLLLVARDQARHTRLVLGDQALQDLQAELMALGKSATTAQVLTPLAITALAAFLLTSRR